MTILSQQLLKLRREATSSLDVDKRKRVSILFEPGEAMKMTPEVVLEIARTGCHSLKQVDKRHSGITLEILKIQIEHILMKNSYIC